MFQYTPKTFLHILLGVIFFLVSHHYFYQDLQPNDQGKKAIIVGASSGIGKALACVLSNDGYEVGIVARRLDLLQALQKMLPHKSYVKQIDVGQPDQAIALLQELAYEMGGYDMIIINSGIALSDQDRDWCKQKQMIDVNVVGFAAIAHEALNHFIAQKHGHIIGISSIAALRGGKDAFTYCATKAFDSVLLEGIRNTLGSLHLPIYVTDVKPGYVDTDMVKNSKNKFWQATPDQAAKQIYDAIKKKQKHVYVTKRWRLIAWIFKLTPDWIYHLVAQ